MALTWLNLACPTSHPSPRTRPGQARVKEAAAHKDELAAWKQRFRAEALRQIGLDLTNFTSP